MTSCNRGIGRIWSRRSLLCIVWTISVGAGCANQGGAGIQVGRIDSAAELKAKMDAGNLLVIHALNAEHFAKGHIPGAKNIDIQDMTVSSLPADKAQPMVFYCGSVHCPVGHDAAQKAASWGYSHVWYYAGGIADWRASGMQVATGTE
ncbi:MAG: rhodanese-like domain-containing protein [Phycisphaerae bacterium]|nr:rhodanese-like domain-containing protein [Phycisphaerae bacterium]